VAYGSSIPSHDFFVKKAIYVHEAWHVDTPDTFAIVSRNAANAYFGLHELMRDGVLCLGGPNFDPDTLSSTYLVELGYNSTEIVYIQQQDCRKLHTMARIVKDQASNKTWSPAGFSEKILKRKLAVHGYSYRAGNLKYIPIFMFLVRFPMQPVCFFLEARRLLKPLVNNGHTPSSALAVGCHLLAQDIQAYHGTSSQLCLPRVQKLQPPESQLVTGKR
jgi:hypothetical protein